jgi:hypothetical protein
VRRPGHFRLHPINSTYYIVFTYQALGEGKRKK